MEIEEELKLVAMAKEDIRAFDKLYDHYLPKIFAYCLNRTLDRHIAEDIVSEVFTKALESLPRFNHKRHIKFGSWLYAIAHNVIIDQYRHNKKMPIPFDESHDSEDANHAEDSIAKDEVQKMIAFTLIQIKPRYQEVISLRYYADYNNSEIAQALNIKEKAANVLIHRALAAFKKKMQKIYPKSEIISLL